MGYYNVSGKILALEDNLFGLNEANGFDLCLILDSFLTSGIMQKKKNHTLKNYKRQIKGYIKSTKIIKPCTINFDSIKMPHFILQNVFICLHKNNKNSIVPKIIAFILLLCLALTGHGRTRRGPRGTQAHPTSLGASQGATGRDHENISYIAIRLRTYSD